jgi:formate dehydrogenase assembly factor FdhD
MTKKITKPEGIPIRKYVADDRNYDILVEEIIHAQTIHTNLVLENMRNGVEASEVQIKSREALHGLMAIRDAIKNKKKTLEAVGIRLEDGRKIKVGSVIRTAIAKLLQKDQTLKNPALWSAVASKPPRGWSAFDNNLGKYLEGKTAEDHMAYARFCTVCGEERKKIKR